MSEGASDYRVLARKYRPANFAELIGQEALVRTLSNAIRVGRVAHAFILTGVRGIGKTTTARIIAKALNCLGPEGDRDAPATDPCNVCDNCRAIADDRHVDVIEMDAASHTGVDDVREIIEAVRYRPVSARFKVYIVDEVHMLSRNAFNALLKTLEEPPEHVKFIFATTEIRKVPVTVLSRCQRFDLRRVPTQVLSEHFGTVAARENATLEPAALAQIARAADGSVRDGLSILDQAIAEAPDRHVAEGAVREMLGLADRLVTYDLFEALMRGEAVTALELFDRMYEAGADPGTVLQDMADLVHWLTRARIVPAAAEDAWLPEAERSRGRTLASELAMPVLTRAWQLILKGIQEVNGAPMAKAALEMVLIRIAYAASLPTPAEIISSLRRDPAPPEPGSPPPRAPAPATPAPPAAPAGGMRTGAGHALALAPAEQRDPPSEPTAQPADFGSAVQLFSGREPRLYTHLLYDTHLVAFRQGHIELGLGGNAPPSLAGDVGRMLTQWTGAKWTVSVATGGGEPSLAEQREGARRELLRQAESHPLVQRTLRTFPGSRIVDVRRIEPDAPLTEAPDEGEEDQ